MKLQSCGLTLAQASLRPPAGGHRVLRAGGGDREGAGGAGDTYRFREGHALCEADGQGAVEGVTGGQVSTAVTGKRGVQSRRSRRGVERSLRAQLYHLRGPGRRVGTVHREVHHGLGLGPIVGDEHW